MEKVRPEIPLKCRSHHGMLRSIRGASAEHDSNHKEEVRPDGGEPGELGELVIGAFGDSTGSQPCSTWSWGNFWLKNPICGTHRNHCVLHDIQGSPFSFQTHLLCFPGVLDARPVANYGTGGTVLPLG